MSLAAQLSGLRQQQVDANRLTQKRPPSFIYTHKHAATVSNADLHDLAQNAWDTLATVDSWFAKGYHGILGEQAKNVDRTGLTREENDKLDVAVNETLRALGQHALLKPAGVIIEWLVRKFRIHEFNFGQLVALYLPYHSHPQFPSALALVPESVLEGTHLACLIPARTMLAPIPLQSIVDLLPPFSSVSTARAFLDYMLRLPLVYLENGQEPHRTLNAFWLQTFALYLEKVGSKLPLGEKNAVLSTLTDVMRLGKSAPDTLIASYILLARFALHYPFIGQYETTVLKALIKSAKATEVDQVELAMLTTVFVISHLGDDLPVDDKFLGKDAWKVLLAIDNLPEHIIRLNHQYPGDKFMKPFLHRLVHEALYASRDKQLLNSLLGPVDDAVFLPEPIIKICVDTILTQLVALEEQSKDLPEAIVAVARKVYQRFPGIFAQVSASLPASKAASKVTSNIQLGVAVPDAILAASAPDAQLRIDALSELFANQQLQETSPAFVRDTLVARLTEDDPRVLAAVLDSDTLAILHAHVSADDILRHLSRPIANPESADIVFEYLTEAFVSQSPEQVDVVAKLAIKRILTTRSPKSFGRLAKDGWLKGCAPPKDADSLRHFVEKVVSNVARTDEQQLTGAVLWAASEKDNVAALLLLPALVKASGKEVRAYVVEQVYRSLRDHVEAVSVPDAIYDNVTSHPQTRQTKRILRFRALFDSLASLDTFDTCGDAWLGVDQLSTTQRLLREIFEDVLKLSIGSDLLNALFKSSTPLIGSPLSFFASIYTDVSASIALRNAALVSTKAFVSNRQAKGTLADYQIVVPSLLVTLHSPDEETRRLVFEVLESIKAALGSDVFARDSAFYRSQRDLQFLGSADVGKYLDALLSYKRELLVDPAYLATIHAQLDKDDPSAKKKASLKYKLVIFLYSHMLVWHDANATVALTRALGAVRESKKYDLAHQLLASTLPVVAQQRVDKEQMQSYVNALLSFYEQAGRKWLEAEPKHLSNFIACLEKTDAAGTIGDVVRLEALRIAASTVFNATRSESRLSLFKRLVSLSLIPDARLAFAARECLRQCPLDDETFVSFLNQTRSTMSSSTSSSGKASKRARTSASGNADLNNERAAELTLALELVDFKQLSVSRGVISGLFDTLSMINELPSGKAQDLQYTAQLALTALSTILSREDVLSSLPTELIRINPILDLMRSTTNPQTSQQCLSLLASLAAYVPDQLVTNVMPIFTFMGANVLQRDDAYSLRVVEQTIDRILPALVQQLQKGGRDMTDVVTDAQELLKVFVSAANHVPRHRRTKLFVRFVQVLGPLDFLAPICTLLLRRPGKSSEPRALPLAICEAFPAEVQLSALDKILEQTAALLQGDETMEEGDAADDAQEKRELESLQLLDFFNSVISSAQLASKADAAKAADQEHIDEQFTMLIQSILDIWLATDDEDIRDVLDGALDSVGANMSALAFGKAIETLFAAEVEEVQVKALGLFARRLPTVKTQRRADLTPVVNNVVAFASSLFERSKRPSQERQQALAALHAIVQTAQKDEDAALSKVLSALVKQSLVSDEIAKAEGQQICGIAAPLCAFLGTRLIAQVSEMAKMAVKVGTLEPVTDRSIAALKLLDRLVAAVPNFLGANLDYILKSTASLELWCDLSDARKVAKTRSALFGTISKKVPVKTLFTVLPRTYESIVESSKGGKALREDTADEIEVLFDVLERTIRQNTPSDVMQHYRVAYKFLLTGLDLRRSLDDTVDEDDLATVEKQVMEAFVQLVLKLSENAFRPLFLRTYDWAVLDLAQAETSSADDIVARKIVIFKLFDALVQTLRSIIVPYFSFMLDQTIELLEGFAKGDEDDEVLWQSLVGALTQTLAADDQGFWTESRLRKVLKPVAAQLLVLSSDQVEAYHTLLAELADKLSPYESLLKELHHALLMSTRSTSDDLELKRSAIEALHHLWEHLGPALVPFVPESMPFLSEALEETEGGVEAATRRLVKKIESHLGESLQSYLEN